MDKSTRAAKGEEELSTITFFDKYTNMLRWAD